MNASWRPSLRKVSYYPRSKVVEEGSPKKLVSSDSKVQPMVKPRGPHPEEVARTGQVWRSKQAESLPQGPVVPAGQMVQPPEKLVHAYDKETFLFVRQLMMDAGESGEASTKHSCPIVMEASTMETLMGTEAPVSQAMPNGKLSEKLSTDSACSTTDTLSDTSEDQDAASSVSELPLVEGLTAGQVTLRASAPEFVPNAAASVPDLVQNVHPQMLSSTPVSPWGWASHGNITDAGGFHGGLSSHAETPVMKDVFSEVDSQRYLEWRRYCGLTTTLCNDLPQGFRDWDAHRCSIAELFATAKPGQLFACSQN